MWMLPSLRSFRLIALPAAEERDYYINHFQKYSVVKNSVR